MDTLVKKITQLNELLKAIKAIKPPQKASGPKLPTLPGIKQPAPPSMVAPVGQKTKMVGQAPDSKKDPKKVAQQIKDGSMSTKTQKTMFKAHSNGQWYIDEMEKASANPANEPKDLKIKQLQGQIDAGTYKPDPAKIASKMIKEEVEKAEPFQEFHIHSNGQQITAKPVTLQHVNKKYGSVQRLESSGHKLIPVKSPKIV